MKTRYLAYLCLSGLLVSQSAIAAVTSVFEDFSSGTINATKYPSKIEFSRTLDTTNQNVILSQRARAFTNEFRRNRLKLQNKISTTLQADLTINSVSLGNTDSQSAFVGLGGNYYNSQQASATNGTGDVFARLAFGDIGNGLQVFYVFSIDLNADRGY